MTNNNIKRIGSRAEVFHGQATKTSGGLTKNDLIKNKIGRIVSKKKVQQSKKSKFNPLLKMGLLVKKGSKKFGRVNIDDENSKNSKSNFNNLLKFLS